MAVGIRISLPEGLFLREPQDSKLGRKIIKHSILLIDEVGFESFNFKKLATEIGSTEASIYRYFENKHLLLIYLFTWYWEWVSYLIKIHTLHSNNPVEKLKMVIKTIVLASEENPDIDFVNETILHRVMVAESPKVLHTKDIDNDNKEGFFINYKNLIDELSCLVLEIKPNFKYPHALVSNIFEMTNNSYFYANHIPSLTNVKEKNIQDMIEYFVFKLLN